MKDDLFATLKIDEDKSLRSKTIDRRASKKMKD